MTRDTYLLANRHVGAGRRLELLGELFDAWTLRHIDELGIAPGWRCWEVGAGGASIPRALAERVGPSGHVLATDLDISHLVGLPAQVEVRPHDLARDPAPSAAFDLVHARLVLTHVAERERALQAMAGALRPGGWLLVEDADPGLQPLACIDERGEAEARANRIRLAMRALLAERGADLAFGRRLPQLLAAAGLVDVRADGFLVLSHPACRELELATMAMVGEQIVAAGRATDAEIASHVADVASGAVSVSQPLLISAWATCPGSH